LHVKLNENQSAGPEIQVTELCGLKHVGCIHAVFP